MIDAKFDLSGIQFAEKTTREAEAKILDCTYGFEKICSNMDEQYTFFQSDKNKAESRVHQRITQLQGMITTVERQKSEALSKKQKEQPPPKPQALPQNCTPEQKQAIMSKNQEEARQVEIKNAEIRKKNAQIDEYAHKCNKVIEQLKETVVELNLLNERVKKEGMRVDGVIKDFRSRAFEAKNSNRVVVSASATFNYALGRAYDNAQKIELLDPYPVSSRYDITRDFTVKNTHTHVASPSIFSRGSSSSRGYSSTNVSGSTSSTDVDEIVSERDADLFFAAIDGRSIVNMPSANVRRLGGKKFTDRMEEMGYELIRNKDGSIIDKNGIVHWEKK